MSCSLDATALRARIERWRRLAEDALLETSPTTTGARHRYRRDAHVDREIAALIAAEADCCPTLAFDVARDESAIVLDVRGPADAVALIASRG